MYHMMSRYIVIFSLSLFPIFVELANVKLFFRESKFSLMYKLHYKKMHPMRYMSTYKNNV